MNVINHIITEDILVVIKVVDTFSRACFVETELLTRTELWHWPPLPLQWIPTANICMALCIMKYNTDFYLNTLVTCLQDTIYDMFCCLNLMQLYKDSLVQKKISPMFYLT